MDLQVTRDSVAMGDDVLAPHARDLDLGGPVTVERVARWLARGSYLASVHGGSTWVLREDGRALAVVAFPDSHLRDGRVTLVAGPGDPVRAKAVHVDYALAADPEELAARLRADPAQRTR